MRDLRRHGSKKFRIEPARLVGQQLRSQLHDNGSDSRKMFVSKIVHRLNCKEIAHEGTRRHTKGKEENKISRWELMLAGAFIQP